MFITRRLTQKIKELGTQYPILAITGPRQSGKTTLLREAFPEYRYITLEDPEVRQFAETDPRAFLDLYDQYVIFDEAQRAPLLFSYMQGRVDESGLMGQFILSGSQNFLLLKSITQSLAGRVALFKLLPFDFFELDQNQLLPDHFADAAIKGTYPAVYSRKISPQVYYDNYIQTYIEKDVTELINIKDFSSFKTFLKLCANRAGQLLNISALANEADIAFNTAKDWLSILESSYIIFFLEPYYENRNKRLVKTPKVYFYDTGLLCFLLGIKDREELLLDRAKGSVFENMIVAEQLKRGYHLSVPRDLYFWQDSNKNEIDLLWKENNTFQAMEIKATQTVTSELFKQLDKFEAFIAPAPLRKMLMYGGAEDQQRTNYTVLSWRRAADAEFGDKITKFNI
ncbi:MAG TPA: ATP-binding protein [Sphingobacteriaceae bacterium]|nr:ATP-binding protein [Sphingobacteriaceae bacterium]